MLRGEYTSERGGCHGNQTSFNGGEDPGGQHARAPRSGPRGVREQPNEIGRWRGVRRAGAGRCGFTSRVWAGSGAIFRGCCRITEDPAALGDFGRKVVKTANLGLRSEDVRRSAAQAQQLAAAAGGTVLSSQVYRSDDSVTADLVLSIPSEEFERVVDELRSLGEKVTTDSISGQDVTEEYVDLKSRERNLRATEESLLRLYDRAENVEEALSIQRELTTVRGEIELVQGRIKYLDQRSAYSQITLNIQPVTSPPPPKPTWDPGDVVERAWDASLAVLQVMATAIISAVVFGWWLAPVLLGGIPLVEAA